MTPEQIDTLKGEIHRHVQMYWKANTTPILLSSLGAKNSGQIAKELKASSMSLNDFIDIHLKDEVAIYRDENNPIKIGAFPFEVTNTDGFSAQSFFDESQKSDGASISRYNHAVWAAFRVPLPTKHKRYIDLSDGISFVDLNIEKASPPSIEGSLEIKKTYIKSSKNADAEAIAKSIQDWAASNNLDESVLFVQFRHQVRKSVMSFLMDSLTEDELSTVSMPLSIVKKLSLKQV